MTLFEDFSSIIQISHIFARILKIFKQIDLKSSSRPQILLIQNNTHYSYDHHEFSITRSIIMENKSLLNILAKDNFMKSNVQINEDMFVHLDL